MHHETGPPRDLPKVKFRVLIAGRANAGKTTILQRVCGTTESLETYRIVDGERTKIQLSPTSDRGEHEITDELEFSNHDGYVFHDSCGLENGSTKELETLQKFVRERAEKNKLKERLHVIWYCIPMDDRRPSLNIEPLKALQIDKNVPVIAVFTKCDAFRRNMRMDLEDQDELRRNTQMDSEDEDEADDDYLDWLTGEIVSGHIREGMSG
ncbi:hypothetical protein B0H14DRAFT_239811 [Mycena olivaceomarginata]|nr:hypothetical protein B0H14DRAFT_239811 [Mycena olivaceomarginata]